MRSISMDELCSRPEGNNLPYWKTRSAIGKTLSAAIQREVSLDLCAALTTLTTLGMCSVVSN